MIHLFDRYDAGALTRFCEEAGVLEILRSKGFTEFAVEVVDTGLGVPHLSLRADKAGRTHVLLEAWLRRIAVASAAAGAEGMPDAAPLDLLMVHWIRAEDPTAAFARERPPLLLQTHPGLGVIRRAFRVAVRIAVDLGADGVANCPKLFHDAVIFHHSRLFLFLDGREQGRFEALRRDLAPLSLRDASIAVAAWCVRDAQQRIVRWEPGYQVFPISARLTEHFHSARYAADVAAARAAHHFHLDLAALIEARSELLAAGGATPRLSCDSPPPQRAG